MFGRFKSKKIKEGDAPDTSLPATTNPMSASRAGLPTDIDEAAVNAEYDAVLIACTLQGFPTHFAVNLNNHMQV